MEIRYILALVLVSIINCSKLPKNCGTNNHHFSDFSWRIVGGQKALKDEFPWQVLVRWEAQINGSNYVLSTCGGTIINENWILTAAHCVHRDPDIRSYNIYLGYNDLNKLNGNELKHSVSKIVKHELFDYELQKNDIALIKMNETIDFENRHKSLHPICLPNTTNESKHKCYATGFGYHNENDTTTDALMKVPLSDYDIRVCKIFMDHINPDSNLCFGGVDKGGLGTCKGDSGGPLQCQSSDGKWYQIGIVSWGLPCAHAKTPDVYTRVAYFHDWIEKVIDEN